MAVIEVEDLRKEYRRLRGGRTVALDGLDLAVPEGGVFGFLGPNGAGKTTTIRCLLGLIRPSGGRARLLGADSRRQLASVLRRVGSIVETPTMYPRFSGRRNLELLARLHRIPHAAIEEVLDRVGLSDRAGHLVKTYSLGMKQRLGIAGALLKDPEVLILDEPANGLDPAGIVEVRQLLRRLAAEGRTVFVSSHILSEVQQVADRVAILARGRCVASPPVRWTRCCRPAEPRRWWSGSTTFRPGWRRSARRACPRPWTAMPSACRLRPGTAPRSPRCSPSGASSSPSSVPNGSISRRSSWS